MIASAPVELEKLVELELPPVPGVAMRVGGLVKDVNASTRDIADALGHDPILAARILRVANSALYCFQRQITALPMAVNALGNETIHSLVFVSVAADAFQGKGRRSRLDVSLWEHSLAVGLASREIMSMLKLRGIEEAFLCGLLHDFGKLLLLRYDGDGYEDMVREAGEADVLSIEKATFGYTHAQVGAVAAKRWDLPEEISHAIYFHHDPSQADQSMLMGRVIDVADALANRAGLGLWRDSTRDLVESESVFALQLTDSQLNQIWEKTEKNLADTFALFAR